MQSTMSRLKPCLSKMGTRRVQCHRKVIKMDKNDIVVKIDFFTWETMPERLKEIAKKQGFIPPNEDEIIAVKTIMTKEEREAASKLESEKEGF